MKTVLITGASRGIGAEIATKLAEEGFNIIVNYNKSENEAKMLVAKLKSITGALACKADVSKHDEVLNMIVTATQRFGNINYVVNNAGIAWTGLFTDMSSSQCDSLIDTNIKGVINVTKAVLPNMIDEKFGAIVNISSIWGVEGASCEVVYSATKSAIIGFTKALSKEVAPSGIRVNCICPGVVETDMLSNLSKQDKLSLAQDTPLQRLGSPRDIANAVSFLLSKDSSFITGQSLVVDGGLL
ncbi:MAG: glucose 1-dehydrogenase [Clostridia bacterium]